jgi:hypothetical protein
VTERSWVLNGEGLCTLTLAANDAKANESILQYGNFITVEHELLPMWTGVIDTDRSWGAGLLTINAWSVERLFKFRRSPNNTTLTADSAGTLYKKLIDVANTDEDLRVVYGDIWRGGSPRDQQCDGKKIYELIAAISQRTGNDWSVEGAFDASGRLYFQAGWYEQKGSKQGLQLREGFNITTKEVALSEQGEIVNDVMGYGDGSTPETRIFYSEIDALSRGKYGLRQIAKDFNGNKEMTTLQQNVREALAANKTPVRTISVSAVDEGNTFKALRLGNTLPLYMTSVGFLNSGAVGMNTNVRIVGMRYNEALNEAQLIVREII